ncbi:MAG: serine protease [Luteolibacter sp.]|uniref:S1 family peptidase n=1 Tax=Luteolibacter sp. TaxID=1962973 RepID=UPI003266791F
MKKIQLLPALVLCFLPMVCKADDADKDRIKELERKMAELENEKARLAAKNETPEPVTANGIFESDGRINPRISNAVLIIEGDVSVGTGFIVSADGKKYVYTAAHVFSGNSKLTIRNANGTAFKKFGALEAAEGADLVRLEVLEDVKDFLEIVPADSLLQINTKIAALGNGGGNGVVSVEQGKILGTSGDTLEVDAGIIQGNSGGPVVEQASGKAVGLVTHLTSERKDLWSEGTRQGEVRRFACRLNKEWKWKLTKIGTFLAEGKSLAEFDNQTRLCFAVAQLQPLKSGLRLDTEVGQGTTAMQIIQQNMENASVKALITMNTELASRKTGVSDADLRKKFSSLLGQIQSQAVRSNEALKPQDFAWFHRNHAEASVQARKECLTALKTNLENLR